MFEAKNISYERGDRNLFSKLSFLVSAGQALHIMGDNGAGKSSLLKLLSGIAKVDEGNIFWQNTNIAESTENFYSNLLFIGHKSGINHHLSAEQNLSWYATLSGQKKISKNDADEIFKKIGLYGFEDIPSAKLSAGQQRRIALCRLLIEKKKLWLLDEPLVSLDKQGVSLFESLLEKHLTQQGIAVFTSHQNINITNHNILSLDLKQFKDEHKQSAS